MQLKCKVKSCKNALYVLSRALRRIYAFTKFSLFLQLSTALPRVQRNKGIYVCVLILIY